MQFTNQIFSFDKVVLMNIMIAGIYVKLKGGLNG